MCTTEGILGCAESGPAFLSDTAAVSFRAEYFEGPEPQGIRLMEWQLRGYREAKEKNRESWYMAYIMDTNDEERAKGKTVEVGHCSRR